MKFADLVQTADWKTEKHVPAIEAPEVATAGEKILVKVSVGKEIAHPNTTEHHIRWIKLYFKPEGAKFGSEVAAFEYNAHGESTEGPNKGAVYTEPGSCVAVKLMTSGTFVAVAYCNIHGFWESEKTVTVQA